MPLAIPFAIALRTEGTSMELRLQLQLQLQSQSQLQLSGFLRAKSRESVTTLNADTGQWAAASGPGAQSGRCSTLPRPRRRNRAQGRIQRQRSRSARAPEHAMPYSRPNSRRCALCAVNARELRCLPCCKPLLSGSQLINRASADPAAESGAGKLSAISYATADGANACDRAGADPAIEPASPHSCG